LLAELAARQGHALAAEARYRQALALGRPDGYLLGSYADFLLDAGRRDEVVALLQGETAADNLLLRLAEASGEHVEELAARYAASRARGDRIHLREEARFTLRLRHDARAALALALENWAIQREPADARVLLEAARAAGDRDAARPALAWLRESGLEDPQLAR